MIRSVNSKKEIILLIHVSMCWGLVTCTGERIPWSACPQANDDKMCECTCPMSVPVPAQSMCPRLVPRWTLICGVMLKLSNVSTQTKQILPINKLQRKLLFPCKKETCKLFSSFFLLWIKQDLERMCFNEENLYSISCSSYKLWKFDSFH